MTTALADEPAGEERADEEPRSQNRQDQAVPGDIAATDGRVKDQQSARFLIAVIVATVWFITLGFLCYTLANPPVLNQVQIARATIVAEADAQRVHRVAVIRGIDVSADDVVFDRPEPFEGTRLVPLAPAGGGSYEVVPVVLDPKRDPVLLTYPATTETRARLRTLLKQL